METEIITTVDIPALVEAWHARLVSVAMRYVGPDEAEDRVQEAWFHLLRALADGLCLARGAFSTWMYRAVTRCCLDVLRRARIVPMLPLEHPEWEPVIAAWEGEVEAWADVMQALEPLPRIYQQVMWLLGHEYSGSEIARLVKLRESTVRMRILRARQMLREQEVA